MRFNFETYVGRKIININQTSMIAINNAIHLFKMERNHERGIEEAVNMA